MAVDDSALEPLVTECPNCSTRFRVTEAQLQVAHGRVRCGACLTVFQGTDHLFLDGEPYTPGTESFSKLDDELDELLDELSGAPSRSKTPDSLPGMPPPAMSSPRTSSLEPTAPDLASLNLSARGADDDFDSQDIPAELAALEEELMRGLREESLMPAALGRQPPVEPPPDASAPPVTDDVVDIEEVADHEAPEPETVSDIVPEPNIVPETEIVPETDVVALAELAELAAIVDVAQAALAEEGSPDVPEETEATAEASSADSADSADAATGSDDAAVAWVDEVDDHIWQGGAEESAGSSQSATGSDNQAQAGASVPAPQVLGHVEREVLEAGLQEGLDEPAAPRPWITYVLILVALVGLPVQVLWYQFEDWSVDPQMRPVYAFVCNVLECQLPQMTDISQIESKDKIVRSHPDVADALIVDLLIVNNAEFAQPFPIIELTFTSLQGALIAGRRFKPEEYLTGELSASDLFAPRTPVHVSLEVEDPGETAVNYNINFR